MERAKISLGAAAILSLIYQLHYTCIRFFAIFIMSIAIKHIWFLLSNQWFPMLHVSVWLDWTFVIIISLQSNGLSLRTSITVVNRILMGYFPIISNIVRHERWKIIFQKKTVGFFQIFSELTLLYIRHEKIFFSAGIPNQSKSQTEKKEKSFFNFLRH